MQLELGFHVRRFIVSLVCILILDAVWLSLTASFYNIKNAKLQYGFIAWTAIAFALSCGRPFTFMEALQYGAFIGFVSYATFNGTELAINPEWTLLKATVDMCWGTLACGVVTMLLYKII